ncbi:MAG: hypothetical protein ACOCZM_00810 [Bacillota bacterium]
MRRYIILVLLFLLAGGQLCYASGEPSLVLVLMDQVVPRELTEIKMNNLEQIQKNGAFGLINMRKAKNLRPESTYLTAANGKLCQTSKIAHTGYNTGDGVINPEFDQLRELNEGKIGCFGTLLRENGITPALLGNSDTDYARRRTAVSLVMDDRGRVPRGDVGESLLRKLDRPPGYLTDWKVMRERVDEYRETAGVLVVETGDISRIEDAAERFNFPRYRQEKKRALAAVDEFLGFLWKRLDREETVLAVLSLSPPARAQEKGHRLGWLLAAGGGLDRGWFTSASTRRKGLLTVQELLPFSLQGAGVKGRQNLTGKTPEIVPDRVDLEELIALDEGISQIYRLRIPYIRGFVVLQIILIFFSVLLLYRESFPGRRIIHFLSEYLLLALLFVPVNFLFLSQLIKANIFQRAGFLLESGILPVAGETVVNLLFMFVLTVVEIILLGHLTRRRLGKIIFAVLFMVVVVTGGLVSGPYLISDSLLGSSSVIGARFYGLGNEYAGLFSGAILIGFTGLGEIWKKFNQIYLIPLFALALLVVGFSRLGANFGVFLSLCIATVFTWLYLHDYRFGIKNIAIISGVFSLTIILLGVVDYMEVFGPSSHIGNAVRLLIQGDFQGLMEIALRKLRMNYRLFKWTIWTRVLLVFILYLLLLFRHPFDRLQRLYTSYPRLTAGFYGSLTGGVVAMLVNDSGIVAAATMLFFPVMSLLYLLLGESRGISRS